MKQLSVSKLVGLLLVSSLAVVILTMGISMTLSNRLLNQAFGSIKKSSLLVEQIAQMKDLMNQIQADTVAIIAQKDIDKLEVQVEKFNKDREAFVGLVTACELCDPELKDSSSSYSQELERLLNEKVLLGKNAEASEIFINQISLSYGSINSHLNRTKEVVQTQLEKAMSMADEQQSSMRMYLIGLGVLGTLILLAISIPTSLALTRRLKHSIDSLVQRWERLTTTATDLSTSSQQLSNASTTSASSLEETSATVEQITSIVQQNAEGAAKAAELAHLSLKKVQAGSDAIKNLIHSVSEMDKSSKEITNIVAVIDDISFQTNLLALNAAVEAARAGEHGKGFAVVADAVRSLALRSSNAAKEIGKLIQDANERTTSGISMAKESSVIFEEILKTTTELNTISETIAVGSREQSNGLKQINIAINQLDQVSQTSAQTAQTSLDSARNLNTETENLKTAIGEIKSVAGVSEAA